MACLLDLPVEVRWKIYQYFTKANEYHLSPLYKGPGNAVSYVRDDLTLFRVNRQICHEAHAVLDRVIDYHLSFRPSYNQVDEFEHDLEKSLQVVPTSSSPRTTVNFFFFIVLDNSDWSWLDFSQWLTHEDLSNGSVMDPRETSKRWREFLGRVDWSMSPTPLQMYPKGTAKLSLVSGENFVARLKAYLRA